MWERILNEKPMEMREVVNKRVQDGTPFSSAIFGKGGSARRLVGLG